MAKDLTLEHHRGTPTGAGQALRHAQPEAAVAAGDEGHVAGQVEGRSRGGGLDGSGHVDGR